MKKLSIIGIAFLAVSFASCKKDYTCTCTDTNGGSSVTKIIGVNKKTAKANCVSTTISAYGYAQTKTCTLSK